MVNKEGKSWYKKHTEAKYFSDLSIERDSLDKEFHQVMQRIRELNMGFIFEEPTKCNIHLVREFYATGTRQDIV